MPQLDYESPRLKSSVIFDRVVLVLVTAGLILAVLMILLMFVAALHKY